MTARFDWILPTARLALAGILADKLRFLLTSFGIFLAISTFIIDISFIRGMRNGVERNMESIGGARLVTVNARFPTSAEEQLAFSRSPGLTAKDMRRLQAALPGVQAALPETSLEPATLGGDAVVPAGILKAVGDGYLDFFNYPLAAGRRFSRGDLASAEPACLLGSRLAADLFPKRASVLGREVAYAGRSFRVIGVHTPDAQNRKAREMLIPYASYARLFAGSEAALGGFSLAMADAEGSRKALAPARREMRSLHRGVEDYVVTANGERLADLQRASAGLEILIGSVAAIALLVGSISVMNIMLATVSNQIREFGIRIALGAGRAAILGQTLIESTVVCAAGSFPALLLGLALNGVPRGVFPFDPQLASSDFALAGAMIVATGMCGGLVPALKACRIDPITALRY
jgi:putative ABC transport system permease protein